MAEDRTAEIRTALSALDTKNDEHWTDDGAPRIEALDLKNLKRKDITNAAPAFTRATPVFEKETKDDSEPTREGRQEETEEAPSEVEVEALEIDGRLAEIATFLDNLTVEIERMQKGTAKLQKEQTRLIERRATILPPPNQAQMTQDYLRGQNERRMRRHANVLDLERLAGGKVPISAKAPIDQVRARSIGHGHTRKVYPTLNKQE